METSQFLTIIRFDLAGGIEWEGRIVTRFKDLSEACVVFDFKKVIILLMLRSFFEGLVYVVDLPIIEDLEQQGC